VGRPELIASGFFFCNGKEENKRIVTEYLVQRWTKTSSPDPRRLREMVIRDGYDVFEWADRPNTVYAMHSHSDEQSHWIISGRLELTIESVGTFALEAGDRDFMPPETRHSARVVGEQEVRYLIGSKK